MYDVNTRGGLQVITTMWNLVPGNKLIQRKRKEEAFRRHVRALHTVKPMVNNSAPRQYGFLYSRPKAHQIKLQRQLDIENHNDILVERMMKSTSYVRPRHEALLKESLNSIYRNKVGREIDQGNQKLVRRLQSTKSQYSKLHRGGRDYSKYKSNLAQSRMDPFYDFESQTEPLPRKNRPFSAKR